MQLGAAQFTRSCLQPEGCHADVLSSRAGACSSSHMLTHQQKSSQHCLHSTVLMPASGMSQQHASVTQALWGMLALASQLAKVAPAL